jgi:hypothetical protein
MICEKHDTGELCKLCDHNKDHSITRYCRYSKCLVYAVDFAERNKSCDQCTKREDCSHYDDLLNEGRSAINLFTHGNDCPQYRACHVVAHCV